MSLGMLSYLAGPVQIIRKNLSSALPSEFYFILQIILFFLETAQPTYLLFYMLKSYPSRKSNFEISIISSYFLVQVQS